MAIGFLLEADVIVGRGPVAILKPQGEPLYAVPNEERQVEQLALLSAMDQLVVHLHRREVAQRENEPKKINRQIVSAKGMSFDLYYVLHIVFYSVL